MKETCNLLEFPIVLHKISSKHYLIIFLTFSDGYTTDDLVFLWKEGDPVQVTKNLHLPRFTLEKYLTAYCTSRTNTGNTLLIKNFLSISYINCLRV
jgi:hypothetical protein